MKKILVFIATLAMGLSLSANAHAIMSVLADYTYSGSEGNYLLDFRVTNNIPASNNLYIYFFGVNLAEDPAQGYPPTWIDHYAPTWNHYNSAGITGGSNINYPTNWKTQLATNVITSGTSKSGFTVHASSLPSVINYYAYAFNWTSSSVPYYGADAFRKGYNPGFESTANSFTNSTVPEPATMGLFGMGGIATVLLRRKKKLA